MPRPVASWNRRDTSSPSSTKLTSCVAHINVLESNTLGLLGFMYFFVIDMQWNDYNDSFTGINVISLCRAKQCF